MKIKKSILLIFVNIILMVVLVFAITIFVMPQWLNDITGHGIARRVPNVIGLQSDYAVQSIAAAELNPIVVDTVYSDGRQPGEVIEQLPEGGLPVKPHRPVYLTINAYNVRQVTFPDVIQWSSRQALSMLKELNFVADSVKYEPFEFDDLVLSVTSLETGKEMEAGTQYPIRTHVVVHVGSTQVEIVAENDSIEETFFE
ncbi:MAG: PASTA domain-containing protein [Bacteroidales bacterium]|nr:PASTA domain-containing protein [Candidatus Liminaster caballi]